MAEDKGAEANSQQETFRALWSNSAAGFPENRQNTIHSMNCIHPDFQTSQYMSSKATFHNLQQALQTPEERESKEEPAETPKEDRPNPVVNNENSGTLWLLLPSVLIKTPVMQLECRGSLGSQKLRISTLEV